MGGSLRRLFAYRHCLWVLAARALKVRYRRSVFGFAWSLAYPLLSMAILTLVFARVFPAVRAYPLYVVVGVLAWGFLSLSCVQAMESLIAGAPILRRIAVPAAVFPLAAVASNLVHLLLSLAVLPAVMAVTGSWPAWHPFLLLAALGALAAFAAGLALALAAVNLFFRDVRYFFDALSLLWFYATPVVYPAEVIPQHLRAFLWANPMFWQLALFRAALYEGRAADPAVVAVALGLSAVALVVGWAAFARLERKFHLYL
ncbi:MAG: ABC transporter permease [Candidatus Dadabacteria bacterium]|nr:MAG: ABC transporter permease [Candidatus Dadabacteria bacterium]